MSLSAKLIVTIEPTAYIKTICAMKRKWAKCVDIIDVVLLNIAITMSISIFYHSFLYDDGKF